MVIYEKLLRKVILDEIQSFNNTYGDADTDILHTQIDEVLTMFSEDLESDPETTLSDTVRQWYFADEEPED